MTTSSKKSVDSPPISNDLKAEQALGLIGLGLMQKISKEDPSEWNWSFAEDGDKTDLHLLKQRLELTSLAIETGAPLSTAEVTQLLGARPGSSKTQRGGLVARRVSRNVWRLNKSEQESSYWRN